MRIYRQDRRARRFVGVVEEAGVEGKRAFTTVDELWRILTASRREAAAEDDIIRDDAPARAVHLEGHSARANPPDSCQRRGPLPHGSA